MRADRCGAIRRIGSPVARLCLMSAVRGANSGRVNDRFREHDRLIGAWPGAVDRRHRRRITARPGLLHGTIVP